MVRLAGYSSHFRQLIRAALTQRIACIVIHVYRCELVSVLPLLVDVLSSYNNFRSACAFLLILSSGCQLMFRCSDSALALTGLSGREQVISLWLFLLHKCLCDQASFEFSYFKSRVMGFALGRNDAFLTVMVTHPVPRPVAGSISLNDRCVSVSLLYVMSCLILV